MPLIEVVYSTISVIPKKIGKGNKLHGLKNDNGL